MSDVNNSDLGDVRDALRAVQRFIEDHGRASDIGELPGGGWLCGPNTEFDGGEHKELVILAHDAERRMEDAGLSSRDDPEIRVARDLLREPRLNPR